MGEEHSTLEQVVERLRPPRVRNAARNAFRNLRDAWTLHPVDAEMSLFRAITAEEEAATALIVALKQQGYPNANRLRERFHPHKAAVWPLIAAISEGMREKNVRPPHIALAKVGRPRIEISVDIGGPAGLDKPLWGTADHPFNFVMRSDKHGPFQVHDFEAELQAVASARGARDIREHVLKEANARNECLYASDRGIPSVQFTDDLIVDRLRRVTAMIVATIGIMQTRMVQPFIVQCLSALLKAVEGMNEDDFDYPHIQPLQEHIRIAEQPDGSMKAWVIRPTVTGWSFGYKLQSGTGGGRIGPG